MLLEVSVLWRFAILWFIVIRVRKWAYEKLAFYEVRENLIFY